MAESTLRDWYLSLYPRLRERLSRKLGSVEQAEDALNETFLKVDRLPTDNEIRNPPSYLFRMALNTARDQRRAGSFLASAAQIDEAMAIADRGPDAQQVMEGHRALATLIDVVETLTPRQRHILEAVRLEGRSCKEVAEEMRLSKRTVEVELRLALDCCSAVLKKSGYDFANRRGRSSIQ